MPAVRRGSIETDTNASLYTDGLASRPMRYENAGRDAVAGNPSSATCPRILLGSNRRDTPFGLPIPTHDSVSERKYNSSMFPIGTESSTNAIALDGDCSVAIAGKRSPNTMISPSSSPPKPSTITAGKRPSSLVDAVSTIQDRRRFGSCASNHFSTILDACLDDPFKPPANWSADRGVVATPSRHAPDAKSASLAFTTAR